MYEVHASYRYNRSKAKILHRIKLNNVIWADIFSFLYKRAPNTKEKCEHLTSLTFLRYRQTPNTLQRVMPTPSGANFV